MLQLYERTRNLEAEKVIGKETLDLTSKFHLNMSQTKSSSLNSLTQLAQMSLSSDRTVPKISSRKNNFTERNPIRVLFAITAFNRKQHVHLKQMILSIVSMCDAGWGITILLYTADSNLFSEAETLEMKQLSYCTRIEAPMDLRILVRSANLQLKMTMEHRLEFKSMLNDYDLFVYAEDDMQIDVRHLTAYITESGRLDESPDGERYLIGFLRYEENGISLGHTQVIWENSDDAWFPLEINGKLYMMPQNVHGGVYISTRKELKVSICCASKKYFYWRFQRAYL